MSTPTPPKKSQYMALPDSPDDRPGISCVMIDASVVEEIRSGIQSLNCALRGDEYGNRGIIRRVEDLEASEKAVTKKLVLWGGIVAGASFVLSFVKSFIFPK